MVNQLALSVEGIVVHHRAAGLEDGKKADHRIGRVGQEQPHLDPLADADLLQAMSGAVDQIADIGVAVSLAKEVDRLVFRVALDRVVHQRVEPALGDLGVPFHIRRVRLEPQLL